jgi:flagellin-like protein
MEIILLVITLILSGRMSNRYLIKKNKAKKGISPVIATVILVAVAVVIAAALAGFSSSLFGTYSSAGAAVTVSSITMDTTGDGNVVLVNSGNVADTLTSVSIVGFDPDGSPDLVLSTSTTLSVSPNGGEVDADFQIGTPLDANFEEGQIVTIRINLSSGAQITQSVIVTA